VLTIQVLEDLLARLRGELLQTDMYVFDHTIYITAEVRLHIHSCTFIRTNTNVHCAQKKTPTHIFFYISMSDV